MDTLHSASRWRNKHDHSEVHAYFDLFAEQQLAVIVVQGVLPPWLRAPLEEAGGLLVRLAEPVHLGHIRWPPDPIATSEAQALFERITANETKPGGE